MIYGCGLAKDGTFARFIEQARIADISYEIIDVSEASRGDWYFPLASDARAKLWVDGKELQLDPRGAYYCRAINLAAIQSDASDRDRIQAFYTGLFDWLGLISGTVVNKTVAGLHNGSKPLHEALLIEHGFNVPESLTTCDTDLINSFLDEGRTISKTVCGVRSDAAEVSRADFREFHPESGPVHLQRLIEGSDVRVHVAGASYIAQQANSGLIDYRSSEDFGNLKRIYIDENIASGVIETSRHFDLSFSGWDFKVDLDGRYWCLEVNPMPGYGIYDRACKGQISRILLHYLQECVR